ncbi:c-type cytochrome [Mucilaginibacter myungsuensis]|uniref:C-type cytochrome n=2 Tax=Mucilaginibacter myungsuensis TaxID=649104 RepID=A0A929PYS7_9SPHI|nr:c-type cytochrome [Mucilaginibacter myungsuensis]
MLAFVLPAMAEAEEKPISTGDLQNYVAYAAIMGMLLLFIIALLVVLRALKVMTKVMLRQQQGYTHAEIAAELNPEQPKKVKNELWLKALSLKPMSQEKSLLIEHDYDGIQELDNPTPAWFMWLFYGTIGFGLAYLAVYHVFGVGQLQDAEYVTEVAQADSAKKVYLARAGEQVDENTVKLVADAGVIDAGKGIFTQHCAACHGAEGQGVVGPNLTDVYWLHGGNINDVFKTIKYGVAAKGMPTWEKQLSPKQISDVSNYILSLKGTNPPNPKAPQGDELKDDTSAGRTASN